ncbi:class I SAM-dependent DNA methyltransferase [Peptoniphilus gorbachii]|uniref:SAM-dependent methyltransferase n=1 Tax=Peptoniphilus gorbachii TaxID=411567 RepID=A0ABS2MJR9_9FIRM|nr:class I SAM-dependent methyltransferase [Peptoniphilus gorbachii]MBM7550267.1 SAM-dependent methyltransferase [Peptoniphilus gorbachii]
MMYGDFAYFYDKLMYDLDYEKIYKFIKEVLGKKSLEPELILEMACGTGGLTEKLARDYKIHAFDLSDDMLSVCENKIRSKNLKLFKQNMVGFSAPASYDAIFSVGDSLNYVTDVKDFEAAIKSSYDHLKDGGIFIFDLNTEYKFKNIPPVTVDEVEDVLYLWENIYDEEKKLNTYGVNFFRNIKDNDYKRFYEEHLERAYDLSFVKNLLEKTGFKDIEVYDDYEFKEVRDETSRYTFITRR